MAFHAEARDLATTELHRMFDALGTQRHAARLFAVTPRHIRRWRSGARHLPQAVGIVCNLLAMGKLTVADVELAAGLVAARTNGGAPPVKPPREAAVPLPSLASPAQTKGAEPEPLAPREEAPEQSAPARAKTAALAVCALAANGCRWPLGDPQHDFSFCSSPALPQQPYCARHHAAAYLAPRPQQAPVGGPSGHQ